TGDDGGVDLVQRAHAFRDRSGRDESQALHGPAEHLEVDAPEGLRHRNARSCVTKGLVGIAMLEQCERTFSKLEPCELWNLPLPFEETPRALQPSTGDGVLASKRPVVPSHPHGDPRCAHGVVSLSI